MRRIWGKFVAFDAKIHARFASHFSRILPIVDAVLEWIHGAVSAPPFGIILTLVLVVLVETHVISTIVALALGLAWVVAFIWIARSKPLRKLTILTRMLVLTAIGIGLAGTGRVFGGWAMYRYSHTSAFEQGTALPTKKLGSAQESGTAPD